MLDHHAWLDPRRVAPRVEIEALCNEIADGDERPGFVIDLSGSGMRLERPFVKRGLAPLGALQLEIELPGIDEIIWARAQVCFDRVRPGMDGKLTRTTGVRVAAAASRDLRLLRDYVIELGRARRAREALERAVFAVDQAALYLH